MCDALVRTEPCREVHSAHGAAFGGSAVCAISDNRGRCEQFVAAASRCRTRRAERTSEESCFFG